MSQWSTRITNVLPDNLQISGYPLEQLVEHCTLLETAHLLVQGELPDGERLAVMESISVDAALQPVEPVRRLGSDDVSKTMAAYLLTDTGLPSFKGEKWEMAAHVLGRTAAYLGVIYGNDIIGGTFREIIGQAFLGKDADPNKSRLLEAMVTACVDHGVTPPSAQATLIAASTRASYEVALAHGVGVITDVHGGAGAKAGVFFMKCIEDYEGDLKGIIWAYSEEKRRIAGLGHRVHRNDPRRDVLWALAEQAGVSGRCTALSRDISQVFSELSGKDLPINVDGVIGALVADLGLELSAAKSIFILGRVAGLSAHYFEEVETQPRMRRIIFGDAVYDGHAERDVPEVC